MDPVTLAQGAYTIANTKIAAAIAAMTIARGLDPRDFSLLAYGAAGPDARRRAWRASWTSARSWSRTSPAASRPSG